MHWFKQTLTDDKDNYDPVIIGILASVLFGSIMIFMNGWHHEWAFDAAAYGNMVSFILGGGGCGYAAKRFAEKRKDDSTDGNSSPP